MRSSLKTVYSVPFEMPDPRPLNETLYRRMVMRLPGRKVLIANQGEAMTGSIVNGPNGPYWAVSSWGETYRANCPYCGDTRHRLWLNHTFGQPDPADPTRTRLGMFYGICFNDDCLRDPKNRMLLYDNIWGVHNRSDAKKARIEPGVRAETRLAQVALPGQTAALHTLDSSHPAWRYLGGQREYTRQDLLPFHVSYCVQADDKYRMAQGRIVAPCYQYGMLVGWQCRAIHDNVKPKYYTMPGMPKRSILYNYDNSKEEPFVVVFEGVTDVWRFGSPSVAILGKTMSTGQRQLLQRTWHKKPIILCLDSEAREESALIIRELMQSGSNQVVEVTLPPGRDPADMQRTMLVDMINCQAEARGVPLPEEI